MSRRFWAVVLVFSLCTLSLGTSGSFQLASTPESAELAGTLNPISANSSYRNATLPPSGSGISAQSISIPTGNLATVIQTLMGELSWASLANVNEEGSASGIAVALMLGLNTTQQVNSYLNDYHNLIFYGTSTQYWSSVAYFTQVAQLNGTGGIVFDSSTIKWALDNAVMMSNGLPQSDYSSVGVFNLQFRSILLGYYYANLLNYETAKWNLTRAYNSFRTAIFTRAYPGPGALYIRADNSVLNSDRYYDDYAETISCFLIFYREGVTQALGDAVSVWNWVNNELWATDHYNYQTTWPGYECAAGGFYQIITQLNQTGAIVNFGRVMTDVDSRFLVDGWDSPMWTYRTYPSNYAVVHMHEDNSQVRLKSSIMAWESLMGYQPLLSSSDQATLTQMLQGNGTVGPAWKQLLSSSTLYAGTSGFKWYGDATGASATATAVAIGLFVMQGIVPLGKAGVAIPTSENRYEDVNFYPDLYGFNVGANQLKFSVSSPGTFNFIFGTAPVSVEIDSPGVYQVTFSADYNSVTNIRLLGSLPTNFRYIVPSTPWFRNVHLLMSAEPRQAAYLRGQPATFTVTVLNQLSPAFSSTLALTITGPSGYYHYDFQPIAVAADEVKDYSFSWTFPQTAGTYVVEVGLVPAQLTAYDAVWLKVT